ncbi:circularly permuted type 2 ATP-grasp protein [Flexithrix dorotheae]|uniref:circularly permuted type 2 ATP-grasp protein n=1 Tax=Flexithrix dorotheae TaxID=70993 RepID=UPI000369EB59|nr:circularly permuted type 2 ATP-grasp protein [Flexithrix dorotheae]
MEVEARNVEVLQNYASSLYSYDEMMTAKGEIRPHWMHFYDVLKALSAEELAGRQRELNAVLRENGVTYNVYNKNQGMERPWELDLIPLIIQNQDWQIIEKGLQQRARLLNLILSDLYGQRLLIKEKLLPLDLIYTHSGFLRQCDGIRFPGSQQLIIHGCDLARGPDGRMWVINDRTQAPSGAGYSLENRSAMLRVIPDFIRPINVQKLSNYFRNIPENLSNLVYNSRENPRTVVLTPGYHNETYFEHAYLASKLGFRLVQGSDLMVKNNYVWLKTLGGLEKVDIILRRVDDTYCDPLELRPDSHLGITGLLSVIRQKNVAVVNPLGSSVLENPGLMAFLPGICKFFLDEELILPSAATWWCGQEKELNYVLENIPKFIIKAIDRGMNMQSVIGSKLNEVEIENLKQKILANPKLYIGQQQVSFSTSPSFVKGILEPRYTVLRTFSFASSEGYSVMPGGLTRSASSMEDSFVSNQLGGVSKDTWVMEDIKNEGIKLSSPNKKKKTPVVFARENNALSSRTAENLFWVGRYLERSLYTARILRIVLQNFNENKISGKDAIESEELKCLLRSLTHLTMTYPGFVGKGAEGKFKYPERELLSVALSTKRIGSLASNLIFLKNNIFAVRDQWAKDTWRLIENVELHWESAIGNKQIRLRKVQILLDHIITNLVAFVGLNAENMQREMGWFLLQIGRRIEQGLSIVSTMRTMLVPCFDEQVESTLQESLLNLHEGLDNYRSRYKSKFYLPFVLELLLMDKHYPKSLAFQFEKLQIYTARLPEITSGPVLDKQEKLVLEGFTNIRLAEPEKLAEYEKETFVREKLDTLLGHSGDLLNETAMVIIQNYFSHTQIQQQLTGLTIDPEI